MKLNEVAAAQRDKSRCYTLSPRYLFTERWIKPLTLSFLRWPDAHSPQA
jgi:hypothetical protein